MRSTGRRGQWWWCNINVKEETDGERQEDADDCDIYGRVCRGGRLGGMSAQDKYTLKVPNGLAFSEFRGYEGWQVSPSVMTTAYWRLSSLIL
jgi:hypothetical protein